MALSNGTRLGPYEILSAIGAGGMGEVYRARDPRLGRDVAIKIISESACIDDGRRRFEQEARAVAALSHPNVLAVFDVGAGDVPFLVTELLHGETLRARVDRGPLSAEQTTGLALQLVAGLAAAHARGIVHRDLKPENVFVTSDGHLKILDFCLARRAVHGDSERPTTGPQTARGTVLGTAGYMAPEQVRGLEADHRADIFACGAILFEMLTGQRAFHGDSPADTMSAVLSNPPSALVFTVGIPAALACTVRRCLEKNADARFQSARDLGAALESASNDPAHSSRAQQTSIAVLPFANVSADADNQYFSEGLSEDLINALTSVSGLRVASRTSSFRFRGPDADVRQIGRDLGAGAILEGSVRRSGARVRITVQLTNTADGYLIWSDRNDREMAGVFEIQDEIVESIVSALAPALIREPRAVPRSSSSQPFEGHASCYSVQEAACVAA